MPLRDKLSNAGLDNDLIDAIMLALKASDVSFFQKPADELASMESVSGNEGAENEVGGNSGNHVRIDSSDSSEDPGDYWDGVEFVEWPQKGVSGGSVDRKPKKQRLNAKSTGW